MGDRATRFLGWFSLGLGAQQLVAPGMVNRLIGVENDTASRRWQRIVGVQELSAATGLLSGAWTAPYLWSRVAADVFHLGLLGLAWRSKRDDDTRLALAIGNAASSTSRRPSRAREFARLSARSRRLREGDRIALGVEHVGHALAPWHELGLPEDRGAGRRAQVADQRVEVVDVDEQLEARRGAGLEAHQPARRLDGGDRQLGAARAAHADEAGLALRRETEVLLEAEAGVEGRDALHVVRVYDREGASAQAA